MSRDRQLTYEREALRVASGEGLLGRRSRARHPRADRARHRRADGRGDRARDRRGDSRGACGRAGGSLAARALATTDSPLRSSGSPMSARRGARRRGGCSRRFKVCASAARSSPLLGDRPASAARARRRERTRLSQPIVVVLGADADAISAGVRTGPRPGRAQPTTPPVRQLDARRLARSTRAMP